MSLSTLNGPVVVDEGLENVAFVKRSHELARLVAIFFKENGKSTALRGYSSSTSP